MILEFILTLSAAKRKDLRWCSDNVYQE